MDIEVYTSMMYTRYFYNRIIMWRQTTYVRTNAWPWSCTCSGSEVMNLINGRFVDTTTIDFTYNGTLSEYSAITKQNKSITTGASWLELVWDSLTPWNSKYYWTNVSGVKWFYDLPAWGGGWAKEFRITVPWELTADISNYQWLYFRNTSWATWTISNVAVVVWVAASWTWAALACNVYKSNGVDSNGINNSVIALFSSAISLWTGYTSLTNVPTTTTVENGRWLSARITSSAWATNRASDLQIIITYT